MPKKKKGEKRKRSLAKAVTWRITATLTTTILVFIFTGNIAMAITLGSIELVIKMFIYYFHERIWNSVGWGL